MKTFKFGVASRDITPNCPVWMYGYGNRYQKSTGIMEPLTMGCLALSDGKKTILLVSCDMIGIHAHLCDELYKLIKKETGITYPDIVISCSHTHFAPSLNNRTFDPANIKSLLELNAANTGKNKFSALDELGIMKPDTEFVKDYKIKMIEMVKESLRDLRKCRLEKTRFSTPNILFNRRTRDKKTGKIRGNMIYPNDPKKPEDFIFAPVDPEVTALRFINDDQVKGTWINFGCHPVTGGHPREVAHDKISSDYPFYYRQKILEKYGCPALFTLGSAGDAVPINRFDDCRERVGGILGDSVILAERTFQTEDNVKISTAFTELPAETIIKTKSRRQTEIDCQAAKEKVLKIVKSGKFNLLNEKHQAAVRDFDRKITACYRAGLYKQNRHKIRTQYVKIGDTVLVGLPFEVLSEYSLKMKEKYPNSVLLSCTGGYQGYLPLAYEYDLGGYEASPNSTHFKIGTTDILLEETLKKLKQF